jgi:squalene-associated FAD-dependent desaturase
LTTPTLRVAVIGAGWAGCAAAVELTHFGHAVTLIESTRVAGGRARAIHANSASPESAPDNSSLDNGQHILLGAYSETLRLMKRVGVSATQRLLRLPLQICYPPQSDAMQFTASNLPAPFHLMIGLIRAKGLTRHDKIALARFTSAARWMGWTLNQDCNVAELLDRFDQTERLNTFLWRPLCLAALNTPPERASAQIFLNVLHDSLGARRHDADMLIPRCNLSELFPIPAIRFVQDHAGTIVMARRVRALIKKENTWQLQHTPVEVLPSLKAVGDSATFDAVVIATSATEAKRLLSPWCPTSFPFPETYEPITTCYLQYDRSFTLPRPLYALVDAPEKGHWGQFVFDRGQLDPAQAGLLAVVISASSAAAALPHPELVRAIAMQLSAAFCEPKLTSPLGSRVISEKRATFSCTPGLRRATSETGVTSLYLAGDYVQTTYPGTIESAVRSGIQAAKLVSRER